jgi:hypothetical protein
MVPNAGLLLASQIQSSSLPSVAPWAAIHCVDTNQSTVDLLSVSFITVWLIFAFLNRIINICSEGQKYPDRSWIFEKLVHRLGLKPKERDDGQPTNIKISTKATKNSTREGEWFVQGLVINLRLVSFFLKDIMNSLAWEIMWISFSFTYGLSATIIAWNSCDQPTDQGSCWENVLQMGLGQMVPLLLLILPAFAFLESFSEF